MHPTDDCSPLSPAGSDPVVERLAAWWPKGVEADPGTVEMVAACRRLVAGAGPKDAREAVRSARHLFNFFAWAHLADPDAVGVGFDELLSDARIGAYVDGRFDQRGSRDAHRSWLERLAPGAGLRRARAVGGTGHIVPVAARPAASAPEPASPVAVRSGDGGVLAAQMRLVMLVAAEEAAVPATLDPAVAEVIDTWAPRTLEPDLWAKVADAARQVVRACVPAGPDEAVRLLRHAAYLGAFVAVSGGPVRPDTMFAPATVTDFLAKLSDGSAAACRPALNRMRAACLGLGRGFNAGGGRTDRQPPYSDAQREALFAAAGRSRSAKRRRHLEAFLCLGFGAGVLGVEMGWVRPDDIRPWGGRLWCDIWRGPPGDPATLDRPAPKAGGTALPPRRALVASRYAPGLAAAADAARAAGERFVLGNSASPGKRGQAFSLADTSVWPFGPSPTRMRTTWLVDVLAADEAGIAEMVTLGGFASAAALIPYADLVAVRRTELAAPAAPAEPAGPTKGVA